MSEAQRATDAYVALGANLGDRAATLQRALVLLSQAKGVEVVSVSAVYETDPVGPPQDDYLNAVAGLRCSGSARELLELLLDVERRCGRDRRRAERWGPRELDLDLLLFGSERIEEDGLEVPHPRLHERPFVLVPLCDVAAEVAHPILGDRVRELALRGGGDGVRRHAATLTPPGPS